jgi:hypothetical protein
MLEIALINQPKATYQKAASTSVLNAVLEILHFRSDNRFQPVVEALSGIQEALTTRSRYFKAAVPTQGVVPRGWAERVFEDVTGEAKVNRQYYELCSSIW